MWGMVRTNWPKSFGKESSWKGRSHLWSGDAGLEGLGETRADWGSGLKDPERQGRRQTVAACRRVSVGLGGAAGQGAELQEQLPRLQSQGLDVYPAARRLCLDV